jgi:hypothetical protein
MAEAFVSQWDQTFFADPWTGQKIAPSAPTQIEMPL